jgi:hypothetical protein
VSCSPPLGGVECRDSVLISLFPKSTQSALRHLPGRKDQDSGCASLEHVFFGFFFFFWSKKARFERDAADIVPSFTNSPDHQGCSDRPILASLVGTPVCYSDIRISVVSDLQGDRLFLVVWQLYEVL